MTGTPNTNNITDLWHQAYIVDDGKRLGNSFYAFRAATQIPKQVGPKPNMVKWEDRPGAEESAAQLLADITIRHKFEDCHDIPANHKYVIPFKLSDRNAARYEEMQREAVLRLKAGTISAVNAASVVTKLLQIASGAVYDENGNYHVLDLDRYELVADILEARKFSVCFFNWTHQRDMLIEEFNKRGLTYTLVDGSVTSNKRRRESITGFQNGFYRVFLAHPQSAAHSLTLVRGTSTVWASPTYNLEHWLQGNRRIYRAGQTEKTETINVIAEGTLEEHVYAVLQTKNIKLMSLLETLA
jgi:SNF2 family DNA or RNA helicase